MFTVQLLNSSFYIFHHIVPKIWSDNPDTMLVKSSVKCSDVPKRQGHIFEMLRLIGTKIGVSHRLHALTILEHFRDSATYWTRQTEFLISHEPKISTSTMIEQIYFQYLYHWFVWSHNCSLLNFDFKITC